MSKFELEILSPEGSAFKGDVSSISLPTSSGIITVLPGHTNLVTKLQEGDILISCSEGEKKITVTGGFVEISNNHVNVVAEFAVPADEANKYKIEQAMKLAKDMKEKQKDSLDMSVVESQLKKAVFELKSNVGIKRKKM